MTVQKTTLSRTKVIKLPKASVQKLKQLDNMSAAIRGWVDTEYETHPELPERLARFEGETEEVAFRMSDDTWTKLENYSKYGLCRAFLARAIQRGLAALEQKELACAN